MKIFGRKWILTSKDGQKLVVEGEGVVGQFPEILAGEEFNYNSYHVISCDSQVGGAFFGETNNGIPIYTKIPSFELTIPKWHGCLRSYNISKQGGHVSLFGKL